MVDKPTLVKAVEQAIGALQGAYRGAATESDLYEASLLALATEAAAELGGDVLLTSDGIKSADKLRFRRGPGNLWLGDFTYARAEFPNTNKTIEIHLGVYVLGTSKVPHECDVALLSGEEAERSRTGKTHPRGSKLIAAIEAKNYSLSPSLNVGRAFLGLAGELGHPRCNLAFPAASGGSVASLIAAKPSQAFSELKPGSPAALRLRSRLATEIGNYLHRK